MKKLLLLILLVGGGLGVYYVLTGELPLVLLSEDDRKVAEIRTRFETARTQFRQSKRASISGVDTTGLGDSSAAQVEDIYRDLLGLKGSLKSSGAQAAAQKLQVELEALRREVK